MAKKNEYVELPSKTKLTVLVTISFGLFGLALFKEQLLFPELSAEARLLLSRAGTFCLFLAGLLASVGFYWNGKAQHNADLATAEMAEAEEDTERFRIAESRLSEARQFPGWIDYAGRLSIPFFAFGSFLILLSLG